MPLRLPRPPRPPRRGSFRAPISRRSSSRPPPLADLVDAFKHELRREDRPDTTVRAYVGDVRTFHKHYEGRAFPADVRPEDLRSYLAHLRSAGASVATIRRRHAGLARFFRWTTTAGHTTSSPLAGVDAPPANPPARRALRIVDLRRYLRAVRAHGDARDIALCELLAATAIRVDELTHARLQDLRVGERSGHLVVHGKGYRERELPLHRDVRQALHAWLGVRPDRGAYLFPGRYGEPLARSSVGRVLDHYARFAAADFPHLTPHVFRHTVATILLRDKKVDLVAVQRLLGHASVATTQVYTSPNRLDLEDAVESLVDGRSA